MWTEDEIDALRELYERERVHLMAFARGLNPSVEGAEDALHAAFEGTLQRSLPPRELRPYIYRAVRNASLDGHRRRRNHASIDDVADVASSTDMGLDIELHSALAHLPPRQRVAVVACLVLGFTSEEAGRLLGTSPNTIATRRRRGLERLRRELDRP